MSENAPQAPFRRPKFAARLVFIARQPAIERELQQGRGLGDIRNRLGLQDNMSYSQFTKLVHRFFPGAMQLHVIKPKPPRAVAAPPEPPPPAVEDDDYDDGADPAIFLDRPPPGFG